MRFVAAALSTALVVALFAPALVAQDFSGVTIEVKELRGSVRMLTGAGGNLGVSAGEDGVFLIDDQFKELSAKIKAAKPNIPATAILRRAAPMFPVAKSMRSETVPAKADPMPPAISGSIVSSPDLTTVTFRVSCRNVGNQLA